MTTSENLLVEFEHTLRHRRHLAESTVRDYLYKLMRLEALTRTSLRNTRIEDLDAFMETPTLSWSTRTKTVTIFRIFHRWGARRSLWPLDVEIEEMRLPKRPHTETRPLTLNEARLLLALSTENPVERKLVRLGLYAGLRFNEIRMLDHDDWFTALDGSERLRVRDGAKGGRPRELPVHRSIGNSLPGVVSRRQLLNAAHRLRDLSGIEDFVTRMLRRTLAEMMSLKRVERVVIGDCLGHVPRSIVEKHYAPPRWDEKVDAFERVEY